MENECSNREEIIENDLKVNHCINTNNEISEKGELNSYIQIWHESFIDWKFFLLKEIVKWLDISNESEKRLKNVNINLENKNKETQLSYTEWKINDFNLDLFWKYNLETNTITLYLWTIKEYLDNEKKNNNNLNIQENDKIKNLIQTVIMHELLHCIQWSNRKKEQDEDYISSPEELFARLNLAYLKFWVNNSKSWLDIKKFNNFINSYYKWWLISLNDYVFQEIVPILDLYKGEKNDLFKLLDDNLIKKEKQIL